MRLFSCHPAGHRRKRRASWSIVPRSRTFRRVRLEDVLDWDRQGYQPAERGEDGVLIFALYSAGHGVETVVEREPEDCSDAIANSMELRG